MKLKALSLFLLANSLTSYAQTSADSLLQFFKKNNKNSSITVLRNGAIVASYNETTVLPIGTLSNILVALELAKHTAYKLIDTAERVPLKEIVKYYFENAKQTDYENWLALMLKQNKVKENTVSLMDVAQGMLLYDVQANAEYLMDKVGFDNIKSSIQSYNLNDHSAIFPPIGALALFQNRINTKEKKMFKSIELMDEEEYCKSAFFMHLAMKNDSTFKMKMPKKIVDDKVLMMWSNRLPQASTKTYASLLQTLINEKTLDPKYYKMLRKLIERPSQSALANNDFTRFFTKESKTINSFSKAIFCKSKEGTETVIVYTFSNLKTNELNQLNQWQQQFESNIFHDKDFVKKLSIDLKQPFKK